jgi:hypothetical protein
MANCKSLRYFEQLWQSLTKELSAFAFFTKDQRGPDEDEPINASPHRPGIIRIETTFEFHNVERPSASTECGLWKAG